MQNGVHGTAARRFGLMSSSQGRHTLKVPSSMRRNAARTLRSSCDSRSRLRIASSRSAACCTSSRASGLFSMAIPSRFRTNATSSACFASRIFLNLFNSFFVMAASCLFYLLFFCSFYLFVCPRQILRRYDNQKGSSLHSVLTTVYDFRLEPFRAGKVHQGWLAERPTRAVI